MISFAEFQKLDLRVAKVIHAEKVDMSDKLLRLELDLGDEKRQILSGIYEWYKPKDLIGKQVVIIANLEPRQIMGLESQGMLLCAGETTATIIIPDHEVPNGTPVV
jgi:methionine--tRNA ligase beta chain